MQTDNWAEQFKKNLKRNLKRINTWHEAKLKHQDYRLTLQRKKVGDRTYIFNNTSVLMVHDTNLY